VGQEKQEAIMTYEPPDLFEDFPPCDPAAPEAARPRLKSKQALRAVFVDYLQLVRPADAKASREEQVGGIARGLKALAKELQVPVVALAQLNREVEHRKGERPRLSDLRESGALEQHADTVILLHQDADAPGTLDLIVAKQRNGPTGTVTLAYRKECYRFENYAPATTGG
jgi:replicative DNA helicase